MKSMNCLWRTNKKVPTVIIKFCHIVHGLKGIWSSGIKVV